MVDPAEHNDIIDLPSEFPPISLSAINTNTLNMSNMQKQIRLQIFYGIVSLRSDVILMSDIRLCNRAGVTDLQFAKKTFLTNLYCSYDFWFQSRTSSRGVGILKKNQYHVPF